MSPDLVAVGAPSLLVHQHLPSLPHTDAFADLRPPT
jgi:hypothetical protein